MSEHKRVVVTLPGSLVQVIDEQIKDTPRTRGQYVEGLINQALTLAERVERLKGMIHDLQEQKAAGGLKPEDERQLVFMESQLNTLSSVLEDSARFRRIY